MSRRAIYGHPTLITRSYISTDASTPILAQSADPSRTQPRGLSNLDIEARLEAALRAKYEVKNPQGQVVEQAPPLVAFFPGTQEVLFQQPDGRLWIAPFLINGDSTFSIGEPTPVLPTYVAASAVPSRSLQAAVTAQCRPWNTGTDADPVIVQITRRHVIAKVGGEHLAFGYGFDGQAPILAGGHAVEAQGTAFVAPSGIDPHSVELHALTLQTQRALQAQGIAVTYADVQVVAAKVLATKTEDRNSRFQALLGELLVMARRR